MNLSNEDILDRPAFDDSHINNDTHRTIDWTHVCAGETFEDNLWQGKGTMGGSCGGCFGLAGQWITILNPKANCSPNTLTSGLNTVGGSVSATTAGSHKDDRTNVTILNSMLLHQTMQKELATMREQRKSLCYVNDFLKKVLQALKKEEDFSKHVASAMKSNPAYGSSASLHSNGNSSDAANSEARIMLPKLGKVYAELRTCIKIADELCLSRASDGLPHDFSFTLPGFYMENSSLDLKGKMLMHVRWLIEARLKNISHFVATYCDDSEISVDHLLLSNDNKRFCKLIEVYNEFATRFRKKFSSLEIEVQCHTGRQFAQSAALNGGVESYGSGIADQWNSLRPCTVFPLSMKYILDLLSGGFFGKTRDQISLIMENCLSQTRIHTKQGKRNRNMPDHEEPIWADASRIEVRPMNPHNGNKSSFFRVIKRVAGVNVPDLDMEKAARECSVLDGWFKKQEHMVSTFMTGLNGKTKLLRRSYNLQDTYLSDDTMSVASSENMSMPSPRRPNEAKSMTWRDSWGNEAVKSMTSHYHEFLLLKLPVCYQVWHSNSSGTAERKALMYPSRDDRLLLKDIDHVLLHSVISNLAYLNVLDDSVHKSLQATSTAIVVDCALSASDDSFCEMLGKCSPSFDKVSVRKLPDCGLMTVSKLCILSLHPLMYIMEMHPSSERLSIDVLPRVESILTSIFWWVKKKIQEFFSSWQLSLLIQICMSDLRQITNISLDCLRLVESCHNHVETNRNSKSAALHMATQHLQNIDSLITNMQVTSGSCMERLKSESYSKAYGILENSFPAQKSWLHRNTIDTETENSYVQELIGLIVKNACDAVQDMDSQSQLAGMTPVITAIYDSCLSYIGKLKIKFSVQGGLQLSCDFSTMINYVTADISGLSPDVQVALSSLHSVKRALHVAELLQSTYEHTNGDLVEDRFRPQSKVRSSTTSLDELASGGELDDDFWLSLRRQHMKKSKTWTSFLPCVDST